MISLKDKIQNKRQCINKYIFMSMLVIVMSYLLHVKTAAELYIASALVVFFFSHAVITYIGVRFIESNDGLKRRWTYNIILTIKTNILLLFFSIALAYTHQLPFLFEVFVYAVLVINVFCIGLSVFIIREIESYS